MQNITAPTCTEHGYTTNTCVNCGDEFVSDYTEKKPHNHKAKITKPTCTNFSLPLLYVQTAAINIFPTIWIRPNTITAKVIEPTCTEHGYTIYTCPDCGKEYIADLTEHKITATPKP